MVNVPRCILVLLLFFSIHAMKAQIPDKNPGQTYTIQATLDPKDKNLAVRWAMDYTNLTGDTLLQIVFHIWGNAFQDKLGGYGQQKLNFGDTDFYFTADKKRIGYKALSIKLGDSPISYTPYKGHADIILINLPRLLAPGKTVSFNGDYVLSVPGFHSRLGTDGQIWQFAHWFPKVARYDHEGWHAMPYLEMGEFFMDFAYYNVTLDLPDSMVLVSTGVPLGAESQAHRKAAIDRSNVGKSGLTATENGRRKWVMEAKWVTDFAWSASADFLLFDTTFLLTGGEQVIGQIAHTPAMGKGWKNALESVRKATQFYDSKVGPYPWPQVTAIQSVKGLSGGMEYPMVTFIQPNLPGGYLETVIAHEIGHNWFFGVLATDERRYPWMDEGLNSYYEHRFTETYPFKITGMPELGEDQLLLQDRANTRTLPLPGDGVTKLSSEMDYQSGSYSIPAQAMQLLAKRVGKDRVDAAFQAYYKKWGFDHPSPRDLQSSFESSLGMDLSWLFEDVMTQQYYRDLKLKRADQAGDSLQVQVANKYQKNLPWGLEIWKGNDLAEEIWFDGFSGKDTVVTIGYQNGITRLALEEKLVPELRRGNNQLWLNGWPSRYRDWKPGFGIGLIGATKPRTYILPEVGYNHHDGWQLGLGVHNQKVFYQPAGFYFGGTYGLESGRTNYHGALYHDVYPGGGPGQLRMQLRAASFSYFSNRDIKLNLGYHRLAPSLEWQSREGKVNGVKHWRAGVYAWFVLREEAVFDPQGENVSKQFADWDRIFALRISRERPDALQPWKVALDLEFQPYKDPFGRSQSYLKTGLEGRYGYQFMEKKFFRARVFAGFFPHNSRREAGSVSNLNARGSFALAFQGHNDYRYDETFIGRNVQDGFDSRQIMIREGGFKTALGPAFGQGQSNDMLLAVNLWTSLPFDLPLKLPLQPYFDWGFWSDKTPLGDDKTFSDQVWWDLGVKLNFFNEHLEVYFPIVQNKSLADLLKQREGNYLSRVTWTARFDLARLPWRPLSAID
jgi:hypothetical protein